MGARCRVGLHSYRERPAGTSPPAGTGRNEIAIICRRCGRAKLVRLDLSQGIKPSVANGSAYGGMANGHHSSPGSGL